MAFLSPPDLQLGDMALRFPRDEKSGRVGLEIFPAALRGELAVRRESLKGVPAIEALVGMGDFPARVVDSLAQVKLVGDAYPGGFAQGQTLRNSASVEAFRFEQQRDFLEEGERVILTELRSSRGLRMEHRISFREGDAAMTVRTAFFNGSEAPVTLEMLSSFSLGGMTPFHGADAPGRLRVHRFRSGWSAEGRLETRTLEELHLERSWTGHAAFSERFGQVGSMPVRRWFPFVAVEDAEAGVVWGAQLAWAGSWQMEIYRRDDDVCLSGGLADRELGHWWKIVGPGECLETPPATLSCVRGGLDDLCDRLTAMQARAADRQPEIERSLPIVFNEWCTTWGDPSREKIGAMARCLKGSATTYLVIDAGWYKTGSSDWSNGHGDWAPSAELFPEGLGAAAAAIREQGLVPGLWFEMETVGSSSAAFSLVDHLLRRDGVAITAGERRFWDLNDPFVIDYLSERVIGVLERGGFGYLKVDYNETIGVGCENGGAESLGEGLRRQIYGVYRFFERIRARLPELVIENCSSGGHRLEPSLLGRTAMSSFSDAHELPEIPIIAANLHRLMLPRQSQIWAVLHRSDSERRLIYSLAATFLGRMCVSGEIERLDEGQREILREMQGFYLEAAPVIREGVSRRCGEMGESWRHPEGWQAVVRREAGGERALVVIHTFGNAPEEMEIPLPGSCGWRMTRRIGSGGMEISLGGGGLVCRAGGDFGAGVVLLAAI